ncbi:very short patch repair endonuclease [Pseudomonas fluorescens]|uniref:very short patch repair endonuclease n=1 Tax=Pseudomonas fluorescens TaxID=294 RepID=UPI0012409A6C|nr:very short patch repair endonuclease [Pseudomonas fluorescens]
MDTLTPEQRRKCMQRIGSKNTKPELAVRSICHRLGYRFRVLRKDLPGSPDIVFSRQKLCIFVHGCFWHRHEGCKYAYAPKSRCEFWTEKFSKNVERDIRATKDLQSLGWSVEVVWECELKDMPALVLRLKNILWLI